MLTLDEIKEFWLESSVNDEHKPLADRTFYNNIDAIRDMFGIDIVSIGFNEGRSVHKSERYLTQL